MSELLDAFDEVGLLDGETRAFLVEALAHAEAAEWRNILEPFVTPVEPALLALAHVPHVLERTQRALAAAVDANAEVSASVEALLRALPGVLAASGLHCAAQCARVCQSARIAASDVELWRKRTEHSAARWGLPQPVPPAGDISWRERYFSLLRPRCDGIYVAECGFRRWVRLGHHMDLRKNGEALKAFGGRGGTAEWVDYRRYVRLLPRDPTDGSLWAFVLQDPCPREFAEKILASGVDPRSHRNPAKSEGILAEGALPTAVDASRLRKRICVGRYAFSPDNARIDIKYSAGDGDFNVVFQLSHGGPHHFSAHMDWVLLTLTDEKAEVVTFNLGRLPEWKGGGLMDPGKNHFARMEFRPKASLEHLL